ncbi:MAG: erythromycin esterase family protein [Methanosarcinales archaeon]|nr:erythromycin esterase family protein [Methanosarcinales archaeon]
MMRDTIDSWIHDHATSFSIDSSDESSEALNAAIDRIMASFDPSVDLLGFGEALHGGEDILMLRNRLFQRLVQTHGFSAIAMENSFPRGRIMNDYVAGRGPESYEDVQDAGFSHGFGRLESNRELVEWMRSYNADDSHDIKLRFYGFDIPVLTATIASPAQVLHFVLDYLASIDYPGVQERRQRMDSLIGPDYNWENQAALADPAKAVGLSPAATALRMETEDLIIQLRTRRPELVANSDQERYLEALQYARVARELLNFHAEVARKPDYGTLMGIRDALMADNLAYIVGRERGRGRGKVMAFAHNSHLQRGKAALPWYTWWPAGSQLNETFGPRYGIIGSAVGVSDENGIGRPEQGTLEARLIARPGPARFIPTHRGQRILAHEIAALPTRSGSTKNQSYVALTPQSFTDFDWLVVLDSTAYSRGAPPLPQQDAGTR